MEKMIFADPVTGLTPAAGLPPVLPPDFAEIEPQRDVAVEQFQAADWCQAGPLRSEGSGDLIFPESGNGSAISWRNELSDILPLGQAELAALAGDSQAAGLSLDLQNQPGLGFDGAKAQGPQEYLPNGQYSPPGPLPPYNQGQAGGPPVQVNNTLAWFLVFAPLVYAFISCGILTIYVLTDGSIIINSFLTLFDYFMVFFVVALLCKDIFMLTDLGIKFDHKRIIFFSLIPYYLYARAKKLNYSLTYSIISAIICILVFIFIYIYATFIVVAWFVVSAFS